MSTAALSSVQPLRQPRSLPTLTIFRHPAARLVKTVPQLQSPPRVNGHVPINTLGVGRTAPSDVVLQDVYGPLSVLVVPDPLDPTIATLVLSVGFPDEHLHGAARRFVLPFRSFQRDPETGQLISQSKIKGFDAADRVLYPGLGAGLKGLDGGSFWFFEDVGEQGALDRYRWESIGIGRRAIWTVWLIGTPAPVVLHLQNLLQSYPAPVPPLPPWLKENNGYPWRDSYIAVPPSATDTEAKPAPNLPGVPESDVHPSTPPDAAAIKRSLPPIPHLAGTPNTLEGNKRETQPPASTATNQDSDAIEASESTGSEPSRDPEKSHVAAAHTTTHIFESSEAAPTASRLTVRSRHLRDGSSAISIGDTPAVILRDVRRSPLTTNIPEYRNSLVAVDNVTGQIVSVLASDVNLDPSESDRAVVSSSSDDTDTDIDGEDQVKAHLQEPISILQDLASEQALGLHTLEKELSSEPISVFADDEELRTPRQSAFIRRPISVYCDTDAMRSPSRPSSILASDTFAPPPLPPKPTSPRTPRRSIPAPASSARDSAASAAFFSADELSYDSDALEIDPHSITHDNISASLISIRGKGAYDLERHRPELLQDLNGEDGGMESDVSGSTVGGPAVRMWRKVRGKSKKKPASPHQRVERQVSEASDRTSKAETALEALSDEDHSPSPPTPEEDDIAPLVDRKARPGHHLPRAVLRTDEVRSIEDRIWREALDNNQLPIDAPYTHLAARGEAGLYPSSILSSPRFEADGSAIELLSAEEKERAAERGRRKQQEKGQRAERMIKMQGGTVLIEFLAGSSRIGASLIRKAGGGLVDEEEGEGKDEDERGVMSVFGYVPLLPQHLLSLLGLSTSSPSGQTSYTSYIPAAVSGLLSDASGWVTSFFSTPTPTPSCTSDEVVDPSKAEAWEYAIPDFDPNSMGSTPRPIYRRKRPIPSPANGFNISSPPAQRERKGDEQQQQQQQKQRYSIVHIDSYGIGRRAFLCSNMPE